MALEQAQQQHGQAFEGDQGLEEHVVKIYRCSTVVKGGRRFSFAALVVVGDRHGNIGIGYGKAREVPMAVDKGIKDAKKAMVHVSLTGNTIPHQVTGQFGASRVVLVPAGAGTGVIAGKNVRPMLQLAGIKDILTKAYGSTSAKNLVKAAMNGLRQLRTLEEIKRLRGVEI